MAFPRRRLRRRLVWIVALVGAAVAFAVKLSRRRPGYVPGTNHGMEREPEAAMSGHGSADR